MINARINKLIVYLSDKNHKSIYLACLRIAISLWYLVDFITQAPFFDVLYSNNSYLAIKENTFLQLIHVNTYWVRAHHLLLIGFVFLLLLFQIVGIGKWITTLVLFLLVLLFQKLNNSLMNGGDQMARLVLMYLIFANSYQHFCWHKKEKNTVISNVVSNLAAYAMLFHLCFAYWVTAFEKMHSPLWQNGQAIYYSLMIERFSLSVSLNKWLTTNAVVVYFFTYSALAFEFLFPVLIWIKKLRNTMLIWGLFFHLFIMILMMIYGIEIIFLIIYPLFLRNEEIEKMINKLISVLPFINKTSAKIA